MELAFVDDSALSGRFAGNTPSPAGPLLGPVSPPRPLMEGDKRVPPHDFLPPAPGRREPGAYPLGGTARAPLQCRSRPPFGESTHGRLAAARRDVRGRGAGRLGAGRQ